MFMTKQHFLNHFQWSKYRTWRRLRIGQLVIEWRRMACESHLENWRPPSIDITTASDTIVEPISIGGGIPKDMKLPESETTVSKEG